MTVEEASEVQSKKAAKKLAAKADKAAKVSLWDIEKQTWIAQFPGNVSES